MIPIFSASMDPRAINTQGKRYTSKVRWHLVSYVVKFYYMLAYTITICDSAWPNDSFNSQDPVFALNTDLRLSDRRDNDAAMQRATCFSDRFFLSFFSFYPLRA